MARGSAGTRGDCTVYPGTPMKQALLIPTVCGALAALAPAAVTLTFDTGTDGFALASGAPAGSSVAHSTYNGGSLAVTAPTGWQSPIAVFDLHWANPAVWAEFQLARQNGGTISYTMTIVPGEQGTLGWFEPIHIANSPSVWDQNFGGSSPMLTQYGNPSSVVSKDISFSIVVSDGAPANDGVAQYATATDWQEVMLGLNSGDTDGGGGTFYIDNFTVTAVPEPSALLLLCPLVAASALRRRRH